MLQDPQGENITTVVFVTASAWEVEDGANVQRTLPSRIIEFPTKVIMSVKTASAWEVLRGLPFYDHRVPHQGNNLGCVCEFSLCMGGEG